MSIFKNPSTIFSRLWAWLGENKTWIFSGVGVAAPLFLFGWLFTDSPGPTPNPEPDIRTSGDCSPIILDMPGGVDAAVVCSELSDKAKAALIRFLESKSVTLEDAQKEVDKWISRYERLVDELAEINQDLDGDDPVLKHVEELVRDGQLDLAERLLESALAGEKAAVARFAVRRYTRAGVRALGFDLEGALEDYGAAYRYRPDEPRYALGYADALSDLLRYAEALEVLQALLETGGLDDATRAHVYHQIGIAQSHRSWFRAAAAAFGQAIALREGLRKALGGRWLPGMQNDLATAYMNRGNALQDQQDSAGAMATYDAAIALREDLRKTLGERWPPGMRNDLATGYYNQALLHGSMADFAARRGGSGAGGRAGATGGNGDGQSGRNRRFSGCRAASFGGVGTSNRCVSS